MQVTGHEPAAQPEGHQPPTGLDIHLDLVNADPARKTDPAHTEAPEPAHNEARGQRRGDRGGHRRRPSRTMPRSNGRQPAVGGDSECTGASAAEIGCAAETCCSACLQKEQHIFALQDKISDLQTSATEHKAQVSWCWHDVRMTVVCQLKVAQQDSRSSWQLYRDKMRLVQVASVSAGPPS